jgi:hypothetical protein
MCFNELKYTFLFIISIGFTGIIKKNSHHEIDQRVLDQGIVQYCYVVARNVK